MNNKKWMIAASAAMLMLLGCEKKENAPAPAPSANSQPAPAPAPAPDQNAANNQNAMNPPQNTQNGQQAMPPGQMPQGQMPQGQAPMSAQDMPQQAPAPEQPPAPPPPLVVPAGRSIPIILSQTLNSKKNDAGETFTGSVATNITVNEEVAIPKGSEVSGTITKSKKQGTFKGQADLAITLTGVRINGHSYPIATSTYAETVKGKGKRTGIVTGGAAAAGALIGGLAGGGKGAAIGAGVGAGGGLAVSGATGGENVVLEAESKVTFKLTKSLTIDRQR